jgi:hypothetical protein
MPLLHMAVTCYCRRMPEALLEKGADPCALDNIQVSCLPQSGLVINVILGTISLDIVYI